MSAFAAELTSRRKTQLPRLASELNHEDQIDYIAVGYYNFKDELASSPWDAELMHSCWCPTAYLLQATLFSLPKIRFSQ